MSFDYVPCVKSAKERCFDSIFPTFQSGNTPRPTLATWYRFCACPDFVKSNFFKQSSWNIEYSGRSEFLFPRRCLIFLQCLRIWFNSVDSHFFVPNLKLPVFGPQKVRENLSPFKQYFRMQTSPISVKTSNNMKENRPKNILCIIIYRSNKVLYRQIRLAFAYIPEVDNLWKQKKNPSEGFNSPRRPARASSPSAHRLHSYAWLPRKWLPDRFTDRLTDEQTDPGQNDPYVSLCLAGDTNSRSNATKVELDLY